MGLDVRQEGQGPALVLRVGGEVDLSTTPALLKAMKAAFRTAEHAVIMDLENVRHMDSSGIAALVEGVRRSKKTGVAFRLARVPRAVLGVLELAKLKEFFDYDDG